jgi:hypothetical protein
MEDGGCHTWFHKAWKICWTTQCHVAAVKIGPHFETSKTIKEILKWNHPWTIPAKVGLIWCSGFRGEDSNVIFYQNIAQKPFVYRRRQTHNILWQQYFFYFHIKSLYTYFARVQIPLRWCVLNTTLCDKACKWFSPVYSTNKTDCHDITKILLKVALSTIPPLPSPPP